MANMFPDIPTNVPAQTADSIGRAPAFDSTTERFLLRDGALVERTGRAAVQQWFDLMLRQQIDRVPIYTTDNEVKLGVDRGCWASISPTAGHGGDRAQRERDGVLLPGGADHPGSDGEPPGAGLPCGIYRRPA